MTRPASASAASVAPHQPATSASEGAELGGKKRILANEKFRQKRRRARQPLTRPPVGDAGWSKSERRAAREVEELGRIVLALRDRQREVEADRAHRRIPDQAHADRRSNQVRIPYIGAAQLRGRKRRAE